MLLSIKEKHTKKWYITDNVLPLTLNNISWKAHWEGGKRIFWLFYLFVCFFYHLFACFFYFYLFISVIVVNCMFTINLFLEKKNLKKKKDFSHSLLSIIVLMYSELKLGWYIFFGNIMLTLLIHIMSKNSVIDVKKFTCQS